jgi:hypothetical protein
MIIYLNFRKRKIQLKTTVNSSIKNIAFILAIIMPIIAYSGIRLISRHGNYGHDYILIGLIICFCLFGFLSPLGVYTIVLEERQKPHK